MASKVYKRGPAAIAINMTPLIDITFQLIIFFILTNNIATEQAVEMRVPVLDQPQTIEMGERVEKVIVNVVPDEPRRSSTNPLKISGHVAYVKVGIRDYKIDQLDQVTADLVDAKRKNPKVEVLLRADSGLLYSSVQPVMAAITQAQISRVNLVAFLPGEQPKD